MLDQPAAQLPVAQRTNPERSFAEEVRALAPGRWRDLPRRGHPRRHQGDPAIGRGLCRRLPGRARLAPGRRAGRIAGPARRARRASRDLHQRGLGRGPAGRLDQLSAARLRHLEVDRRHQRGGRRALQPRIAWRHWRRADRGRRGLRRGRLDHPGTGARLCAEVLAVADGSQAQPAVDRALHREGLRVVGGDQYAGDDGVAHPRLPCHRRIFSQGQQAAAGVAQPSARQSRPAQLRPHLPSAVDLRAREDQGRGPPAGRAALHRRAWPERIPGRRALRPRHHRAGRHHQRAAARPRPAGGRRPGPDLGAERHPSAGARADRRLLQGQARRPHRRGGRSRLHRAGRPRDPAQARHRHEDLRQGRAADGGRVHRRGGDRRAC